jgi:hypothetical protein
VNILYIQAAVLFPVTLSVGLRDVVCQLSAGDSGQGESGGNVCEAHVVCPYYKRLWN